MKPLISVIIPVYNDPEGLRVTLKSVVKQEFNSSLYEIIVIDNGSRDDTLTAANEFKDKYPHLIKILIEERIQSSYAARNKGILSSKGEIIAFIDSDMTVDPDWLKNIEKLISDKDIKYIGCNVEIELKDKSIIGLYDKITGFSIERMLKTKHFTPTCCLVLKKEIIDEIGTFDSRLVSSGDWVFGIKAWEAGFKQIYAKYIKMHHPARDTFKKLMKKNFRIGRGRAQLTQYYPKLHSLRGDVSLKYLLLKPGIILKEIRDYIQETYFPRIYFVSFYFIKWLNRLALLSGYYYERRRGIK
jgi:glycosyltransferase AglI